MKLLKASEKESGTKLENIKVGDYKISTNYLQAKKLILEGNKSFFKKHYDNAIENYDKAIDMEPYSADAWYNKGSALEELSKYDEAIKCYDNAIDIEPDYVNAWYAKGKLLHKKNAKQKTIISILIGCVIPIIVFFVNVPPWVLYNIPISEHENMNPLLNYLFLVVILIIISAMFFLFWFKDGNEYYRRLSKITKRKIIVCGFGILVSIFTIYFFIEFAYSATYYVEGLYKESFKLIIISLSVNFFLFLYNTIGSGEYYLSKSKELGKSF